MNKNVSNEVLVIYKLWNVDTFDQSKQLINSKTKAIDISYDGELVDILGIDDLGGDELMIQ